MTKHNKSKGLLITLASIGCIICLSIVLMNSVLASAETSGENELHTDETTPAPDVGSVEDGLDELNILVYTNGNEVPEDAISPQMAVAVTSDVVERVYGAKLNGRVFVTMPANYILPGEKSYLTGEPLVWVVQAQTDIGYIHCNVDAMTGEDYESGYTPDDSENEWDWFDNWDVEEADRARLANEIEYNEIVERDSKGGGEGAVTFTDEQLAELYEMKSKSAQEYADSMAGHPAEGHAVDFVNNTGIAGHAVATDAAILMGDADPGNENWFVVQVTLDNGKYVLLHVQNTSDMEITLYQKIDIPYFEFLYG